MGPDDNLKRNSDSRSPQPNRPVQRPIQDFRPHPSSARRPIQDFRPAPMPQRPIQPKPIPRQNPPEAPRTFSPYPISQQQHNKKRRSLKTNKLFLIAGLVAILIVGFFAFTTFRGDSKKPDTKTRASIPLVNPEFTVYYPKSLPSGLTAMKSSITYSKDSFTFILQQDGQNRYFIYEQPVNADPGLKKLKKSLAAPTAITLSLGSGIAGDLDAGTVTAVKTNKDTVIIINCTKASKDTASITEQILSNMQVNDDLGSLRRSNL